MVMGIFGRALIAAMLIATYIQVFSGRGRELGASIAGFLSGAGYGAAYAGYGLGAGFAWLSKGITTGISYWINLAKQLANLAAIRREPPKPPEIAVNVLSAAAPPIGLAVKGFQYLQQLNSRTHENMKAGEREQHELEGIIGGDAGLRVYYGR